MTLGLLILRLVVGLTMAAHGSQKLFGWFGGGGISGTGAFFEGRLGFRPGRRYAAAAALTEVAAGIGLAVGLFTPLAAAALIGTMLVAAVAANGKAFFITKGGYEYDLVLATCAAALAFVGPGRLSVDRALGWDLHGTLWGIAAIVIGGVTGSIVLTARGRVAADDTGDTTVEGGREAVLETSDGVREDAGA